MNINSFKYPTSNYLGAKPCGPNCNPVGCNPRPQFKEGTHELALARKQLRLGNNRVYMISETVTSSPILNNGNVVIGGSTISHLGGLTPCRAFMNAGDPALTYNSPNIDPAQLSGWSSIYKTVINQVSSTKHSSNATSKRMSGRTPIINYSQTPNNTQGSLWTGNNKFVYDGSDYVKYKKLRAENKNYNDITYGGDNNNASSSALLRIRR